MSQERFLTVPSTGDAARPFEVLLDEASAALPADFPTSAGQVLVALDIDGTILTPAGATPRVLEGIHGLAAAGAHVLIASGRALEGVIPVLGALDFTDGWALCNNGATLVHVSGGQCEIVEERTFVPGACLEEIAYLNHWITRDQLLEDIEPLKKNQYGHYLMDVLAGKYIDIK